MFNKNYLGHDFKTLYNTNYICTKCKISIWHSIYGNEYWVISEELGDTNIELKLSCDQIIIKNIIE